VAEKHDALVARFRERLIRKKYDVHLKNPFVDYRPDICAVKKRQKLFVEVEIESTLQGDHTLHQLKTMHKYLIKSRNHRGLLVVPKSVTREAKFLIRILFDDERISVVGL